MRTALALSAVALTSLAMGCAAPEPDAMEGEMTVQALDVGSASVELLVNNGAPVSKSKTVTLTFVTDTPDELAEMCVSNSPNCTNWVEFSSSMSWTMAGEGPRSVYVWLATMDGEESTEPLVGTVTVDTTKPVDGMVTAVRAAGKVNLTWDGYMDAGTGIAKYKVVYATGGVPGSCSMGTPLYSGTVASATHKMPTKGTTYGYRVCALDAAGNMSSGAGTLLTF